MAQPKVYLVVRDYGPYEGETWVGLYPSKETALKVAEAELSQTCAQVVATEHEPTEDGGTCTVIFDKRGEY